MAGRLTDELVEAAVTGGAVLGGRWRVHDLGVNSPVGGPNGNSQLVDIDDVNDNYMLPRIGRAGHRQRRRPWLNR